MILNPPLYNSKQFGSLDSLGWLLHMPAAQLIELSNNANTLYYLAIRKRKPDGSFRDCYAAHEPLRSIQKRILDLLLRNVYYPAYLMGGIRDRENPRDYVRNAAMHAGAGTLIQEDIASFFPSTTQAQIASVFRGFFHFPADVADCLAKLCTRNNELVQGASPSTYLANLIFWNREPLLEAQLRDAGLRYTRLVDDINVSCRRVIPAAERERVVRAIHRMILAYGYAPKRAKQAVASTGAHMSMHGLNIDRGSPKLTRKVKKKLRSAVLQLELRAVSSPESPATWTEVVRVRSRLAIWRRLDAGQAQDLWRRTDEVRLRLKPLHTIAIAEQAMRG